MLALNFYSTKKLRSNFLFLRTVTFALFLLNIFLTACLGGLP